MNTATKLRARILIVDDHPIVREGLAMRIASQPDMEVCGEAGDASEALARAKISRPELVIVDLALGQSHGLDLIQQLRARYPDLKMLVVSAHDDSLYAERCLHAGAHGYINKNQCQSKLLDALRTVLKGECYLNPELSRQLIGRAVGASGPAKCSIIDGLTNRELQVFHLLGQGLSTKLIAARLFLSPHTIDRHREKIKVKLNLKSGLELQRTAMEWTFANR